MDVSHVCMYYMFRTARLLITSRFTPARMKNHNSLKVSTYFSCDTKNIVARERFKAKNVAQWHKDAVECSSPRRCLTGKGSKVFLGGVLKIHL